MKKFIRVAIIILASLSLMVTAFVIYANTGNNAINNLNELLPQLSSISPQAASVANMKQYTQPDPYSCSTTTISITASFLNNSDLTPESLIAKYNVHGSTKYEQFVDILSKECQSYSFSYVSGKKDVELIGDIQAQLAAGIPVPVFFGAQNPYNKPFYDFHASVVTGLDLEKQLVDIVNAYGYTEQVSLVEFLNRMSYRGGSHYPFVQRAVAKLGLQPKNAMVIIAKK